MIVRNLVASIAAALAAAAVACAPAGRAPVASSETRLPAVLGAEGLSLTVRPSTAAAAKGRGVLALRVSAEAVPGVLYRVSVGPDAEAGFVGWIAVYDTGRPLDLRFDTPVPANGPLVVRITPNGPPAAPLYVSQVAIY